MVVPARRVQTEYMKRFREPQWDACGACYLELLRYRLSRRLLEQAHRPWLWDGWQQGGGSSSGNSSSTAASPSPPPAAHDEEEAGGEAGRDGPAPGPGRSGGGGREGGDVRGGRAAPAVNGRPQRPRAAVAWVPAAGGCGERRPAARPLMESVAMEPPLM